MTDRQRWIIFGGAAAVLAAIAIYLTLVAPHSEPSGHARPTRPDRKSEIRTGSPPTTAPSERSDRGNLPSAAPAPRRSPSPDRGAQGEREAKNAPAVAPRHARAAVTVARRFLDGYLPYSYGRARASGIRAAAVHLLGELERAPPRVPATVARARPRLVSVRAEVALGNRAIAVLAVVDDGRRRYRVPLELRESGGRWLVTAIGG